MPDIQSLVYPRVSDREALGEFAESLHDAVPTIERGMARLAAAPGDRAVIADLFRALHNIKGDASLCKVDMAIRIAHPIESLLARLRSGELHYSRLLGEAILLGVDRMELATEALVAGKDVVRLKLDALVEGMEKLSRASQRAAEGVARQLIRDVTGFNPRLTALAAGESTPAAGEGEGGDLGFFRGLALQLEARSPLFSGRTARLLQLASETNRGAGSPVDAVQLEAAVYLHDVGMMFLPEGVWLKTARMSEEERRALHAHPGYGAGLLGRMPGWEGAAEMVLQHHEMPDGGGYPAGLSGEDICEGAKILAIVDAFEAVMQKHGDRGHTRSVLRAIAEINACEGQFAAPWIEPFNAVIRRMVEQ